MSDDDDYYNRGSPAEWRKTTITSRGVVTAITPADRERGRQILAELRESLKPIEVPRETHKCVYQPSMHFVRTETCTICGSMREKEVPNDRILPAGHPHNEWADG